MNLGFGNKKPQIFDPSRRNFLKGKTDPKVDDVKEVYPPLEYQDGEKLIPITRREALRLFALGAIGYTFFEPATRLLLNNSDKKESAEDEVPGEECEVPKNMKGVLDMETLCVNYHGLPQYTDSLLEEAIREGYLEKVPDETDVYYLEQVGSAKDASGNYYHARENLKYLAPPAKLFLENISEAFHKEYERKLKVTSLVRTNEYQTILQRTNVNAARRHPSSHLTGFSMDISYKNLSTEEVDWLKDKLTTAKAEGVLYAIKEINNACFHILVFPHYPRKHPAEIKATE